MQFVSENWTPQRPAKKKHYHPEARTGNSHMRVLEAWNNLVDAENGLEYVNNPPHTECYCIWCEESRFFR